MSQEHYKDLGGLLKNSAQDTGRAGDELVVVVVVSTVIIVYTAG